jgi:hypothetical protein
MANEETPPAPNPPMMLDQVSNKIGVKHYTIRTETNQTAISTVRSALPTEIS